VVERRRRVVVEEEASRSRGGRHPCQSEEEVSRIAVACWGIIEEAAADVREGGGCVKEGGNSALKKAGGAPWPRSGDFDHLASRQCH
jgi:hypothetical protein